MLEKIRERLCYEGADAVEAAYLGKLLPENLQSLPYGISVEMRLSQAVVERIFSGQSPEPHVFSQLPDAQRHARPLHLSSRYPCCKKEGHRAIAVPASQTVDRQGIAGLVSHKMVAAEAGWGALGGTRFLFQRILARRCGWRAC